MRLASVRPPQVVLGRRLDGAKGFTDVVPQIPHIHGQKNFRPHRLPGAARQLDDGLPRLPHRLDLGSPVAQLAQGDYSLDLLAEYAVAIPGIGDDGAVGHGLQPLAIAGDLVMGPLDAPQQLPYRPALRLAVEIPQSHVDSAQADDDPAPPVPVEHAVVELRPQPFGMDGILAEEQVAEQGVRPVQDGPRHARGNGKDLRESGEPLVGVDAEEGEPVHPRRVELIR